MKYLKFALLAIMLAFTFPAFAQTADQCGGDSRTVTNLEEYSTANHMPIVWVQGEKDLNTLDEVSVALGYVRSDFKSMGVAKIAFEDPSQGKWQNGDTTLVIAFDAKGCKFGAVQRPVTELKLIVQAIIKSHGEPA